MAHHLSRHDLSHDSLPWPRGRFVYESTHKKGALMACTRCPHGPYYKVKNPWKYPSSTPWNVCRGTYHEPKPSIGFDIVDFLGGVHGTPRDRSHGLLHWHTRWTVDGRFMARAMDKSLTTCSTMGESMGHSITTLSISWRVP